MINFDEIWKLPPLVWVLLISGFMATVGAGTLWIVVFHKSFFLITYTDKILLLSLSFTVPIWAMNSVIAWCILPKIGFDKLYQVLSWGAVFTCLLLGVLVIMGYQSDTSERQAVLYLLVFEFFYVVCSLVLNCRQKKS